MQVRQQGAFSLIELLISLTILGVFIGLAIPALSQFMQSHRDETLRNMLLSYLHQARAYSIAQRTAHHLCGSSNGEDCDGDWNSYWLVVQTETEQLIQQMQVPAGNELCWRGFSSTLRFQSNGSSPSSNGRFTLCHQQQVAWELIVNRQGRVRRGDATSATCCST